MRIVSLIIAGIIIIGCNAGEFTGATGKNSGQSETSETDQPAGDDANDGTDPAGSDDPVENKVDTASGSDPKDPVVVPPEDICTKACGGKFTCEPAVAAKAAIKITNSAELLSMTSDNRYELANDIGVTSTPPKFRDLQNIIFDGKGHKITGVNWINLGFTSQGVLAAKGRGFYIYDVTFDGMTLTGGEGGIGSTVGSVTGSNCFENINVRSSVITGGSDIHPGHTGGIVGQVQGEASYFENIKIIDTPITGHHAGIGGIVGQFNLTAKNSFINNCEVKNMLIQGKDHAYGGQLGGIIGSAETSSAGNYGQLSISNCTVTSTYKPSDVPTTYGGILGQVSFGYQPGQTYTSPIVKIDNVTSTATRQLPDAWSASTDAKIGTTDNGTASTLPNPVVSFTNVNATIN